MSICPVGSIIGGGRTDMRVLSSSVSTVSRLDLARTEGRGPRSRRLRLPAPLPDRTPKNRKKDLNFMEANLCSARMVTAAGSPSRTAPRRHPGREPIDKPWLGRSLFPLAWLRAPKNTEFGLKRETIYAPVKIVLLG